MPYFSNLTLPFTVVAFTISPMGNLALGLVLLIGADLVIALFIARLIGARRKKTVGSVVIIDEEAPLTLLRRTEPNLRAHRPMGVVEMQVRWRHAAEAHRRGREQA